MYQSGSIPVPLCSLCEMEIIKVKITPSKEETQRLFCEKCNFNQQDNLIPIGEIFKFLLKSLTNYELNFKSLDAMIHELHIAKDMILDYIDTVEQWISQLRININQNKLIKDEDIRKNLSQENTLSNQELTQLAKLLGDTTELNGGTLTLKNDVIQFQERCLEEKIKKGIAFLQDIVAQTNYQVQEVKLQCQIHSMSFNKSGIFFAIGTNKRIINDTQDSYVEIWKNDKNQFILQQQLSHENLKRDALQVCFNPTDDSLLIGTLNGVIQSWIYEQNKQQWIFESEQNFKDGHEFSINCITIDCQSNWIASGCSKIILWKKDYNKQWKNMFSFSDYEDNKVYSLSFSEDSLLLLSGGQDKQIIIFKCKDEVWQKIPIQTRDQQIKFVAFIDLSQFISIDEYGITYWSFNEDTQEYDFKQVPENNILPAAYCYQKGMLVSANLFAMNRKRGKLVIKRQLVNKVECCQISNDGSIIAVFDKIKKQMIFFQK